MTYRFGDSTPFPLTENFIDTLVAVVDTAASLYRADAVADEGHRRAREARRVAADELRRLEALSTLVKDSIGSLSSDGGSRESDRAAARILEQTRQAIALSREAVVATRDESTRVALDARHRELAREALARFFLVHALPASTWAIEWSARESATLLISLQATAALVVELGGSVPLGDHFTAPIKIADFCPAVAQTTIADAAGERRRAGERLGQLAMLELDVSSHGVRLLLGRAGKRAPLLVVERREGERSIASWHGAAGELDGRVLLEEPAIEALDRLCDAAAACLPELAGRRSQLIGASLHGVSLAELEHPAVIAEELLAAVAPLVREMRLRSRVPGELTLKRDLGGDRREELYISRATLTARFADVAEQHRRAFESIGLGDEGTIEFRTRVNPTGRSPAIRVAKPTPPQPPTRTKLRRAG